MRKYPDIQKSFLFVTDGYNFRNTEISAVLGLSQLKRLDKFIDIRRSNYETFIELMYGNENFYPLKYSWGNSSFCFPFICKTREIKNKLISLFEKYKVEYRPVVSGNLLRQPYLNYEIECGSDCLNVDIVHENGVYIGNNQFINHHDMKLLEKILLELQ